LNAKPFQRIKYGKSLTNTHLTAQVCNAVLLQNCNQADSGFGLVRAEVHGWGGGGAYGDLNNVAVVTG
jgi:hypothetical protein